MIQQDIIAHAEEVPSFSYIKKSTSVTNNEGMNF